MEVRIKIIEALARGASREETADQILLIQDIAEGLRYRNTIAACRLGLVGPGMSGSVDDRLHQRRLQQSGVSQPVIPASIR